MERVDAACNTSVLDDAHGVADGSEEMWSNVVLDDEHKSVRPRSVGRCSRCLGEMPSCENDVDSGVARAESESVVALMFDVACGSDVPVAAANLIDVSCGPDAAVVDVDDAGCGVRDVLQSSDDNVLPKDQSDRHTVDLLTFFGYLLALLLYYILHSLPSSKFVLRSRK